MPMSDILFLAVREAVKHMQQIGIPCSHAWLSIYSYCTALFFPGTHFKGFNLNFLVRIASSESCPPNKHSGSCFFVASTFPWGPTKAQQWLNSAPVKRYAKIMCNESSAIFPLFPSPCFISVLVLSMSNFIFFSCYFWNQVSDLRDCHAQEMCFGSSASCVLWIIRSNPGAARWLINLLQNNKAHWRINNVFIASPQWIVCNFLSLWDRSV